MAKDVRMMTPKPYPFQTVTSPPAKPATRRVMGVEVCTVCDLAIQYCKGHAAAEASASDGAESSLAQRVRECKGR